jgi:hypothetical protein
MTLAMQQLVSVYMAFLLSTRDCHAGSSQGGFAPAYAWTFNWTFKWQTHVYARTSAVCDNMLLLFSYFAAQCPSKQPLPLCAAESGSKRAHVPF